MRRAVSYTYTYDVTMKHYSNMSIQIPTALHRKQISVESNSITMMDNIVP